MIASTLFVLGKAQYRLEVDFNVSMRNDVLPDPGKWAWFAGLNNGFASAMNWASFTRLEVFIDSAFGAPDTVQFLNAPSDVEAQNGRFLDAALAFPI